MDNPFEKRLIFIFLCAAAIVINFNLAAVAAILPLISHDLHVSEVAAGKVISYYMIPYGIAALIFAPLTKKFSFAVILGAAIFIFAATSFFCSFASSLPTMLNARAIMGIAASGIAPLSLMLIGEIFEKKVRGRLVGMFFGCSFFASLAGIVCSGIIHWRFQFLIPAALGGMLVFALIFFHPRSLLRKHKGRINYLKMFEAKDIRRVFIFIFLISFFFHGMRNWVGVYLSDLYHMDKLAISFFFTLMAIGGLLGQLAGGHLSDGKSRVVSCYLGVVGLSVSIALLGWVYPQFILGMLLTLVSVFWTIGHNGVSTVLTDFEDTHRPAIASLNSSVRFLSGGLGFYISSFFIERSIQLTFLGIGISLLVLALFAKRLLPKL